MNYQSFAQWCKKFISDDTAFGDIARDIHRKGWIVPNFARKQDILNYAKVTKHWNDAGIETISEMLDIYHDEILVDKASCRIIKVWNDIRKGSVV